MSHDRAEPLNEPRDFAGREPVLADREWLSSKLPCWPHSPSEYAFANIFLFRARHQYRIVDGAVPHLSGVTYDGRRHALPLAPIDRGSADALLATHDCLFPFGSEAVSLAESLGLDCRSEDADSDYIFDGRKMAALEGAKVRRSQARAFEAAHAPAAEAATAAVRSELERVLEGWLEDIGRDRGETDLAECREAIGSIRELGLEGSLVRAGTGEPIAFLLASNRGGEEHVIHFAKGRRAYTGAYPWMFANFAASSHAERINFEQDLGSPGFAQSKRAYGPIERRPKFRLSWR